MPRIRLDAYSCATFDRMTLIRVCDRHFALGDWRATFIDRQIEPRHERTVVDLAGTGSRVISERAMSVNARIDRGESQCT